MQPAFLSDLDGPLQGVPYDGAAPPPADGDTWWQRAGLDPADLYGADLIEDVLAGLKTSDAALNLTEVSRFLCLIPYDPQVMDRTGPINLNTATVYRDSTYCTRINTTLKPDLK